jgi:AAA+ ATPase superfamily predicted ATPase
MISNVPKFFNTVGPCKPAEHYLLPVLPRLPDVDELIRKRYYFILHSPRQSGKTTFLLALVNEINDKGNMHALYCSLEALEGIDERDDGIEQIVGQILDAMRTSSQKIFNALYDKYQEPKISFPSTKIKQILNFISESLEKDLVIFLMKLIVFQKTL